MVLLIRPYICKENYIQIALPIEKFATLEDKKQSSQSGAVHLEQ